MNDTGHDHDHACGASNGTHASDSAVKRTDAHPGPPNRPGLNLDARQRAMLKEMGVHVWWPGAAPVPSSPSAALPAAPAPAPALHPRRTPSAAADATSLPAATAHPAAPTAAPVATHAPAARPLPATATAPAVEAEAAIRLSAALTGAWTLQAPQPLFPNADPKHTPAALGAGWLVVVEGRAGSDPLAGDAGRLLENMLRALQLHRHPRAFVCLLDTAPTAGDATAAPAGSQATLESALAAVQPAVLLLLGRTVARALLGRSEPLGRLRTEHLQVAGVPAVVSYDAPYLLRAAPETKALVWADLCRARALVRSDTSHAPR